MPARHKQTVPTVVRARRIGVPLLTMLALGSLAVASDADDSQRLPARPPVTSMASPAGEMSVRLDDRTVSRSGERSVPQAGAAIGRAEIELQPRWLSAALNVWSGPGEYGRLLLVLDEGERVGATGEVRGDWAQIGQGGRLAWVRNAYLVDEDPTQVEPDAAEGSAADPAAESPAGPPVDSTPGVTDQPCADGSEVEGGLVPNAITVYRTLCAAFPEVSSWGGLRPGDDGFHGSGQAVDAMISDAALGDAVAAYLLQNASDLGVSEILWAQQIWTADRSSEGWRPLEDRGSATANHYDHVHVSVY